MNHCVKCGEPVRVAGGLCWECLAEVHDEQVERIAELERLIAQAESEALAVAESTGCMIVCREGGGLENICGTLALSVERLKDQRDTVKADLGEFQKMLSESQAREGRLRELIIRIDKMLQVPAAEYVPAIGDVFSLIDAALKEGPGNG